MDAKRGIFSSNASEVRTRGKTTKTLAVLGIFDPVPVTNTTTSSAFTSRHQQLDNMTICRKHHDEHNTASEKQLRVWGCVLLEDSNVVIQQLLLVK